MGTRGLTMVIANAKTKVAQYGQWDHYPDGVGATILAFLLAVNLDQFKERVSEVEFFTQEELEELDNTNWLEERPYLSRDLGGDILGAIMYGKFEKSNYPNGRTTVECTVDKLQDQSSFAGDSLFCEWAYVVDLDKRIFEVYEGFNKQPVPEGERFAHLPKDGDYYPVKLAHAFDLDNPPTVEEFLAVFAREEEED